MAIYRYREDFLGADVNLGTEFFLKTVEDLENEYKIARENGASIAELQAIRKQLIQTRHKNNPTLQNS